MNEMLSAFGWLLNNLELLLIFTILGFVFYGAVKGFFAQLGGSISTLIAIILAVFLAKFPYLLISKHTQICASTADWVSSGVENSFPAFSSVNINDLNEKISTLPFPDVIKTTVSNYASAQNGAVLNLNYFISKALGEYIVLAVIFVIIFITVKLLFLLLRHLGEKLRDIEVVKTTDTILGALLSGFKIFRRLSFIFFIISILPFGWFENLNKAIASSYIASFITDHNIYAYILSIIQI